MISPYVRRLRLATEIRALRVASGLTGDQLAKLGSGQPGFGAERADLGGEP